MAAPETAAQTAGGELYCVCRKPYSEEEFMVNCDGCNDWFHETCVGISEAAAQALEKYHCPACVVKFGPSLPKRSRADFARLLALEKGEDDDADAPREAPLGAIIVERDFVGRLVARRSMFRPGSECYMEMHGADFDADFIARTGFTRPVFVKSTEGLGISLPDPSFTVDDVRAAVGSGRSLDVIDVATQQEESWTVGDFAEYYRTPADQRTRPLNVISLEFSKSPLANVVMAPKVVRDVDWIDNVWPQDAKTEAPQVQKYCLMGVGGCYTDFHIDFGGSSVWYHVFKGEKVFYFIEPTPKNLEAFRQWGSSSTQTDIFLGDLVDKCYEAVLREGNTMFIPAGWIHAVHTPKDSLVFGGNFLHTQAADMQFRVYDIERKMSVPDKFSFPSFEQINWFAALNFVRLHSEGKLSSKSVSYIRSYATAAATTLGRWLTRPRHKELVPRGVNAESVVARLSKIVAETESTKLTLKLRAPGADVSASPVPSSAEPRTVRSVASDSDGEAASPHSAEGGKRKRLVKVGSGSDSDDGRSAPLTAGASARKDATSKTSATPSAKAEPEGPIGPAPKSGSNPATPKISLRLPIRGPAPPGDKADKARAPAPSTNAPSAPPSSPPTQPAPALKLTLKIGSAPPPAPAPEPYSTESSDSETDKPSSHSHNTRTKARRRAMGIMDADDDYVAIPTGPEYPDANDNLVARNRDLYSAGGASSSSEDEGSRARSRTKGAVRSHAAAEERAPSAAEEGPRATVPDFAAELFSRDDSHVVVDKSDDENVTVAARGADQGEDEGEDEGDGPVEVIVDREEMRKARAPRKATVSDDDFINDESESSDEGEFSRGFPKGFTSSSGDDESDVEIEGTGKRKLSGSAGSTPKRRRLSAGRPGSGRIGPVTAAILEGNGVAVDDVISRKLKTSAFGESKGRNGGYRLDKVVERRPSVGAPRKRSADNVLARLSKRFR